MDSFNKKSAYVKIISASAVMIILFVIGLAFFLRPSYSENEKRNLTPFPTLTWDSFLSGEYTSQISLWFSDTFPLREPMVSANFSIRELYGIRDEKVVISSGAADDGTDGERIGGYYVKGDAAYELYIGDKTDSDRYVEVINAANRLLGSKAQVYDIVIPLHYSFKISEREISKLGISDNKPIIDHIYSSLDSHIKTVDAFSSLMSHKDEYIYYRTDHHWTALGAYYAYVAFCESKGIEPTTLDSLKKYEFDGFLGTLYEKAERPSALSQNPDTVEAFVPSGTNKMTVHMQDGTVSSDFEIVCTYTDRMYQNAASKYNCFIAGDNPLTEIHNTKKDDGSSVVIVKESYGNAFVPFLVDSYEYVYVIDYRYWKGSLNDFVEENSIDDVLFLNVINATSGSRADQLSKIIK